MTRLQTDIVASFGYGLTIRPGRPTTRLVYQLAARSKPQADVAVEAHFDRVVDVCLTWLGQKFPEPLPPIALKRQTFECEVHGQYLNCVRLQNSKLWSVKLVQPDAPYRDRPAVAGRNWTTEICVMCEAGRVLIGVRTICASLPMCDAPIHYTRPRVVRDLAETVGIRGILPHDGIARYVETDADLDAFIGLLTSPDRALPLVVVSEGSADRGHDSQGWTSVDPEMLAPQLLGLAHVVVLPFDQAFRLTERVTKDWSVYNGAVRTYLPGLSFDGDAPYLHPFAVADRIQHWGDDGSGGPKAFAGFLVQQIAATTTNRPVNWGPLQFYADARTSAAAEAQAAIATDQSWRELYEDQLAALQLKTQEVIAEAQAYNDDAIQTAKERDEVREENDRLRYTLDALRAQLEARTGGNIDQAAPLPEDYASLPDWVDRQLAGRLVLHPRARRALKDAAYEDPKLVRDCLLALARDYRGSRLGDAAARQRFEDFLGRHAVRADKSISESRAGEEGDEYFVRWPASSDKKRFLEWHLRKGNSKEARYCMAIYYFWDEDTRQVVVGWLPSHLDNRLT